SGGASAGAAGDLPLSGAWGQALRSADLGVADGTTDDAGRIEAIRAFGIHQLDPGTLRRLIERAKQL
ncbi:MAG TPA: hypothetical protein DEA08_03965, partial [Planctomycetes bacterium]|nr:hypothetical protein [Planctomycetota bacterium]